MGEMELRWTFRISLESMEAILAKRGFMRMWKDRVSALQGLDEWQIQKRKTHHMLIIAL